MFRIDYPFKKEILACGTQYQANFCLTKKKCGYVVNDLGNLSQPLAFEGYCESIERAKKELKVKPKIISYDLHSKCLSAQYAQSLKEDTNNLKYVPVQHHKAHLASCLAENGIEDKVIGVVFDTAAPGEDGNVWGAEVFTGTLPNFKRAASFDKPMSMAGLFDKVALLLKLRDKLQYPGQGVAELERIVNRSSHVAGRSYEFKLSQENGRLLICPDLIFENISQDTKNNTSKSIISTAFHNTIIEIIQQLCRKIKQKEKIKNVILTGNVFLNKFLFNQINALLIEDGFKMITHKYFPCNDSNISFGQAVLADKK